MRSWTLQATCSRSTCASRRRPRAGPHRGAETIDAVAGWDAKAGTLSLALINYSPAQAVSLDCALTGPKLAPAAAWRIEGPGLAAFNVPGQAEVVVTDDWLNCLHWITAFCCPLARDGSALGERYDR